MGMPTTFCWTRFGTEAGETIGQIFTRKERERQLNGGIFLWGVGNGLAPSMRALLATNPDPSVIFSPILSTPRQKDIRPEQVVTWKAGLTLDGEHFELPQGSLVTSGAQKGVPLRKRYALVCSSTGPIGVSRDGDFSVGRLSNLLTHKKVGASQVTAIVRLNKNAPDDGPRYGIAFRAKLVAPYFVELIAPAVAECVVRISGLAA